MTYNELFIPWAQGIDQERSEIQAQGPYDLQNVQWKKLTTLDKREGFSASLFSPSNILTGSSGLTQSLTHQASGGLGSILDIETRTTRGGNEQLVVITSGSVLSLTEHGASFVAPNLRAKSRISPMFDGSNSKQAAVAAAGDGYIVVSYLENTSGSILGNLDYYHTKIAVVDATSQAVIMPPTTVTTTAQVGSENISSATGPCGPKIVFISGSFHVFYFENSDSSLRARTIVSSAPSTLSSATTVVSGGTFQLGTYNSFDACVWYGNPTNGDCIFLASLNGSAPNLTVNPRLLNRSTLAQIQQLTWQPAADVYAVATDGRRGYVLSLGNNGGTNLAVSSSCSTSGGTLTYAGAAVVDLWSDFSSSNTTCAAVGRVFSAFDGPSTSGIEWLTVHRPTYAVSGIASTDVNRLFSNVKSAVVSGSSIVSGSTIAFRHCELASHGYKSSIDNKWLIDVIQQDNRQSIGMTVNLSSSQLMTQAPLSVWGRDVVTAPIFTVPRAISVGNTSGSVRVGSTESARTWMHPLSTRGRFNLPTDNPSQAGRWTTGLGMLVNDFDPETAVVVKNGDLLVRPQGVVSTFDGLSDVPLGFHVVPSLHDKRTGVDFFPSFTFSSGSGLSAGSYRYTALQKWIDNTGREHRSTFCVPATVVITSSTNVNIFVPTTAFDPKADIRYEIYRTQTSGSTFHLIMSGGQQLRNDVTSFDRVQFVDSLSDSELIGREELLTLETPNYGTISSYASCIWQDRLVCVNDYDGLSLFYSKPQTSDLMPELGANSIITIPSEDGRIRAIAALDDVLVVFKEDAMFLVGGTLANALGDGQSTSVIRLPSNVGCIEPRSVITLPIGIAFRSRYGLMLLDRSRTIKPLGDRVIDVVDDESIVDAYIVEKDKQVRWVLSSGRQLVLDMQSFRWTTFTHASTLLTASLGAQTGLTAGTTLQGNAVIASHVGVFSCSNIPGLDAGGAYAMQMQTPWLNFNNVQGFQKVRHVTVVGTCVAPFTASLAVEYDGAIGNAVSSSYTVTSSSDALIGSPDTNGYNKLVWRHGLRRGKCESLRFTLSEITSSTTPATETFRSDGLRIRYNILNVDGSYNRPSRKS